jgi:hypothetical protein
MKRMVSAFACAACLVTMAPPATAIGVLAQDEIHPDANLGACATVDFGVPQEVIAGEFSVVGFEPLASVNTVERSSSSSEEVFFDVAAILARGRSSWSGCVNGAQDPVRYGTATYTLTASSESGDVVIVWKCVVSNWVRTCTGI